MNRESWVSFLKYMTAINFGVLTFGGLASMVMADALYPMIEGMLPMSREAFSVGLYLSIAFYKALWLVLNVVPLIALSLVWREDEAEVTGGGA